MKVKWCGQEREFKGFPALSANELWFFLLNVLQVYGREVDLFEVERKFVSINL